MRKGEILGLTWEHVDFARGVLLLEQTKNGRRREVPMNRAVYDALQPLYAAARAALPTPAPGQKAAETGRPRVPQAPGRRLVGQHPDGL